MESLKIYFSDYFDVDTQIIEEYGAINISLINDMPLFIDPFLLFNSEKTEYQEIHNNIIAYLLFLQEQAEKEPNPSVGMLKLWYNFPEVKQTWIGFSLDGNAGRGMGLGFARGLHNGLRTIFKDFGKETITKSSHLEKLCLISPLVGRDKISDFTTNFAKKFLLEYTSRFAREYLSPSQCQMFAVPKVEFNYDTCTWKTKQYYLPCYDKDYVLLTPRDLLTRDDTFINRTDMVGCLEYLAPSVEDETLRFALDKYIQNVLSKKKKEMSKSEKERQAASLVEQHPELIDHYIKYKEENGEKATSANIQVVQEVQQLFNRQLQELALLLQDQTEFYSDYEGTYEAAYKRVLFLKDVIENKDGYKLFYIDGKPLHRETYLQIMYRLVWFATKYDVNREVNNGRGPVDFKISNGSKDCTLVEFKLASNSKLRKNLENQVEIYKRASDAKRAIKVILFFTDQEYEKLLRILNDLNLHDSQDIVLIDARDNKLSASNVG